MIDDGHGFVPYRRFIDPMGRILAYDLATFEGDWWLLMEEQALDGADDQRWTIRGDRVFHLANDAGKCSVAGDALVLDTVELGRMTFRPHDAAPLKHLQGMVGERDLQTYCTLMRVDAFAVPASVSEDG